MTTSAKRIGKGMVAMLFAVVIMLSSFISFGYSVHGAEVDASTTLSPNLGEVVNVCNQANAVVGNKQILNYNSSTGVVTFSNKLYSELEMEDKEAFMETALSATSETGLGPQQKNKLYNFIAEQDSPVSAAIKYLKSDASADFVEAKAWFRPFSSPVSIVMGIVCLLVFLFMGLSMIFDCAYLSLPMFQAVLEHGEEYKKPFGVSREAWAVMKEASQNEDRNIMVLYFKRRVPVLVVTGVCLGYVISGQIYDILVYFINAFS